MRATAASASLPFEGGDATKRQVLSVHASRLRPLVPDLGLEWVPAGLGTSYGYLLVGIPASPLAPHAAGNPNQEALRFPVRTGSQSRYMSEAEVGAKYAQRMSTIASSAARAASLGDEPVQRFERDKPWIHLSLVPYATGSMNIGYGTRYAVLDWIARLAPTNVWGNRHMERPDFEIGHRRVTVGMWFPPERSIRNYYGDLHTDGAAFVARQWGERTCVPEMEEVVHFIDLQSLVNAIAVALRFAAAHAIENTGATGTAQVRAGILPANGDHSYPMVIGSWHPLRMSSGSRAIQTVPPIDHVVSLNGIALDGAEWMRSTKTIADDVVQCFGLDEVPQITADGELRAGEWAISGGELERFAGKYGILIA